MMMCVWACVFDVDSYEHWFSDKHTYTYKHTIRFLTSCVECMKTSWMCFEWFFIIICVRIRHLNTRAAVSQLTVHMCWAVTIYPECGIFRNRNSLNVEFNYMHWRPSPEARALYNMHDGITNAYCGDRTHNVSRAHNALMGIVMQPTNRPHCRWRFLG